MKSRISLFDKAVFRKNTTRFAPAWVLFCVALLMFLAILMDGASSGPGFASDMCYAIAPFAFFNFCYAFLCAQLLFGDLFSSRMCNALHAMPLRRETWFFTNVLSGLAFAIMPYAGLALLALLFVDGLIAPPLLWLLAVSLQYIFFFGTAVLSIYCTGNRFAMLLVYLILNGFSVIAYWLVNTLYVPLLYGIELDLAVFLWLCPVGQMISQLQYVEVDYTRIDGYIVDGPFVHLLDGWWYMAICALLGLAYMAIGLWLYRRRQLESAGDFIAVKVLLPVFLVLYTLCAGAVFHGFFSLFVGEDKLILMIIGMTIGVFTGFMLLERTVRVFQKKNWLRYGVGMLIFVFSIALTVLDPLGITRWVPQAEQVESISFYTGGTRYSNIDNAVTDADQIETLLAVHRHGVKNRHEGTNGRNDVRIYLTYTMKSGLTRTRNYYIDVATDAGRKLKALMSSPELVLGTSEENLDEFLNSIDEVMVDFTQFIDESIYERYPGATIPEEISIPEKDIRGLIKAIIQDCKAGTMAQDWNFYEDQGADWIALQFKQDRDEGYIRHHEIQVYDNCVHTRQWIENWYIGQLESLGKLIVYNENARSGG